MEHYTKTDLHAASKQILEDGRVTNPNIKVTKAEIAKIFKEVGVKNIKYAVPNRSGFSTYKTLKYNGVIQKGIFGVSHSPMDSQSKAPKKQAILVGVKKVMQRTFIMAQGGYKALETEPFLIGKKVFTVGWTWEFFNETQNGYSEEYLVGRLYEQ